MMHDEEVIDDLLEKIAALKAERDALLEANQWQLIETAPRDATAILVMRDIWPGTKSKRAEECNAHNTYVAAWWEGENNWICYMDTVHEPTCPIEPTHWMPLPKPPIDAAREVKP